jgi:alkylation response protein AidB-like acyl-CoA dehydrogenase
MDIKFNEEQEMLRKSARDFLTAECPKTKVRELEDSDEGYSAELWGKMAGLGWMGLAIPEEYDGMGMTFQDLTVLLEEMGRNILPGPFICTVVQGAYAILEAGNEEQKKEFLPKIASGEVILTTAFMEPGGIYYEPEGINLKATAKGDEFVLKGTKVFVELVNIADYLICAARTKDGSTGVDGISVFIVDAKSTGLNCEVMPTIAFDKQCEVRFDDVVVPKSSMLGELDKGWPLVRKLMHKASIAKCAESIGGMQACVDLTVAYCKERVQYDRPIGAFQALQHIMSDMWISTQTSKYLVYQVSWMESENITCEREASMAKAYVNENYKWVTERTVSLHGGIGTSREHDAGLYYRRAKAADNAFGDTDYHKELVANKIGLIS